MISAILADFNFIDVQNRQVNSRVKTIGQWYFPKSRFLISICRSVLQIRSQYMEYMRGKKCEFDFRKQANFNFFSDAICAKDEGVLLLVRYSRLEVAKMKKERPH